MKWVPQPIKSSSLQPLKSPSSRSGKFGKRKSLSSDFPQSQSRNKILTDNGPRRSARLLEKRQVSSVPDTSGTKRKILTVALGNAKRFKDSRGKSIEDFQAGLLDLSKESSAKENETLDGVEAKLRSEYPHVIPSSAARTWNKKNGVKVFDSEVKGLGCNEEDDDDDTEEEEDDDTEEEEDDDTEEEEDDDTEEEEEDDDHEEEEEDDDHEEEEDDTHEEEEQDDDTEAGDIEMESDIDLLDSDAQESHVDESNATESSLPNRDEQMEEEDEDKSTGNVDMSPQLMTSSGQIFSDVGINKTSPDDNSILAGPSSRVRTDLTHESAGNNTFDLSSADHAPNLSYHDGNMLDPVFHDEGNEEPERIMPAWNETPLTIQQGNSGQNRWNLIEDFNELYIMLAVAISMALGIGFAVFHRYF